MPKKYELLQDDSFELSGDDGPHKLYRVRALRDFGYIRAGTLGGYIESEANLSHEGNAWVGSDAKVYGNALVCEDAYVYGWAVISGNARICGTAEVDYEEICGDTVLAGSEHRQAAPSALPLPPHP
jgi:hypothetical protein